MCAHFLIFLFAIRFLPFLVSSYSRRGPFAESTRAISSELTCSLYVVIFCGHVIPTHCMQISKPRLALARHFQGFYGSAIQHSEVSSVGRPISRRYLDGSELPPSDRKDLQANGGSQSL